MAEREHSVRSALVEAVRFIARRAWIIGVVGALAALVLRNYGVLLFIVVLVAFWQLVWAVSSSLLRGPDTGLRRGLQYRLTNWGLVYCAVTGLFYFLSGSWGLNLVYLTTAFLLAGFACAAAFPIFMLGRTSAQWHLPPHVFAGKPFRFEFVLTNRARLLSAFGLNVGANGRGTSGAVSGRHVPRLGPGAVRTLALQQFIPERGLHKLPPVLIRSCFPFGMLEASVQAAHRDKVLVLPRLGYIHQGAMLRQTGHEARWLQDIRRKDSQGEFRALREYQYGDNPRHIHWPTTARLRKLYVREFERREMQGVLILLDAHAPPESAPESQARLERFERAVSFAATLASVLTAQNMDYALASLCPDLVLIHYNCGMGHFYSVLEALATAETTPKGTLADLVGALGGGFAGAGLCVVTAGPLSPRESAALLGPFAYTSVSVDVSSPGFDEIFSI